MSTTLATKSLFGAQGQITHDHGCKVLIKIPQSWAVEATFTGPNDCYRPKLKHVWDPSKPMAMIAMKNPSGAGPEVGDQTVMKTSRIFRKLGYGGQWIANACDYRHVNPKALLQVMEPASPGNIPAILEMAAQTSLIVIAHGQLPGQLQKYADAMCDTLRSSGYRLHVLQLSKGGVPMHPLSRGKGHIPENTVPVEWTPTERGW